MNPLNNFDLSSIGMTFSGKVPEEVMLLFLICSEFNVSVKETEKSRFDDLKSGYAGMKPELRWEYWQSWSISEHPNAGLAFLTDIGWLDLFPELNSAVGISLNPESHPEGSLINHTILSVKKAGEIAIRESLSEEDRSCLVFSALCHDLGRVFGDENHQYTSRDTSVRFMNSIGAPYTLTDTVQKLVFYHMSDYIFDDQTLSSPSMITNQMIANLQNMVNIPLLILLHESDRNGRLSPKGGISPGFSRIKIIYDAIRSGEKFRLNENPLNLTHVYEMIRSGVFEDKLMLIPGDAQNLFINRSNMAYREGMITYDELFYLPAYVMSDSYRANLDYVMSLDYRDFSKLFDFAEKNNIDVDNLLFMEKSRLEKIIE
jgi:hypothetical protein